MPLEFDATLKQLVRDFPQDWAQALGMASAGPVKVVTPDLSAVTAFADMVLHLGDRLLHLEFQSGPDPDLARRLLLYNVLLFHHYGLPVHTVVVLLRPRADRGDLINRVAYAAHTGFGKMEFEFEIMRLWQTPVETLLTAGLGMLPLAILGQLPVGVPPRDAMSSVVSRMLARTTNEAAPPLGPMLETAGFILAGLRVSPEVAAELFHGVRRMRESTTYQYILNEGRQEGEVKGRLEGEVKGRLEGEVKGRLEGEVKGHVTAVRKILLSLGSVRFDEPEAATAAAIEAITDPERLERLTKRLLNVGSWDELLATP